MSRLGRYVKDPDERKRYKINYDDWLDLGETVVDWVPTINDNDPDYPLIVDDIQIAPDARSVTFMVSGGADGGAYVVIATMTTLTGQIKEDLISYSVREQA